MQNQGLVHHLVSPHSSSSSFSGLSVPLHCSGSRALRIGRVRCPHGSFELHTSSRFLLLTRSYPLCRRGHVCFSSSDGSVSGDVSDVRVKETEIELLGKPSPIHFLDEEEYEASVGTKPAEMDAALAPFLKFFKAKDSAEEDGVEGGAVPVRESPEEERDEEKGKQEDLEKVAVEYYDPKPGDFIVGVVVSGNENKLDEVLPLYEGEMARSLCDLQKDTEDFMVPGRVGIAKDEEALSGESEPGRPVVEVGSLLFAEVLGRTLSGRPLLSTRRMFRRVAWHRVRQVKQLGEPIDVIITEWNTGGLLTRIEGLRAFLPKAELMNRVNNFTDLKENVGRRISVCITRIDEETNDLIISEREAWDIRHLQEGTLLEGTVRKIFPFGAQVRIGETNRSGLLHISNISRVRVESIGDLLKVDENIADLEGEPGLFLSNKERVFSEAEEMARRYRQRLPAVPAAYRSQIPPAGLAPLRRRGQIVRQLEVVQIRNPSKRPVTGEDDYTP
ncbi:unnamed protein product [Spirodela intermedia]|uniref:S1 motif domain-containing protein n=1 Tax=Spirodela intermedia TaxID=51605 RepID=A0A7I8J842_SPIIN|nr:unnamed protein product [Spirodela intermedia]CAA6666231.1 unnamed protein product [Spirodela intermedia]